MERGFILLSGQFGTGYFEISGNVVYELFVWIGKAMLPVGHCSAHKIENLIQGSFAQVADRRNSRIFSANI